MKRKITRIGVIVLLDILIIALTGFAAYMIRFDFQASQIPESFWAAWQNYLPIEIVLTVVILYLRKMYHYLWRLITTRDVAQMIVSVFLAFVCTQVLREVLRIPQPRSVTVIKFLLELMFMVGMRCVLRFYQVFTYDIQHRKVSERVMLIGAGEAGHILMREMMTDRHFTGALCCAIDDDPEKWGCSIGRVPIVGGREMIPEAVKQYQVNKIILAIPNATNEQKQELLNICKDTGCLVQMLPRLYQLAGGEVHLSDVKDVDVEDLLDRTPIKLNAEKLDEFLKDRIVLVTGGGGSIGSELCRQIARRQPKQLIIVDIYENSVYDLQQELRFKYGDTLNMKVEIASVRDKKRIYEIFSDYRPDVVLHAAAHKHVPLMEDCPEEAIKNNIFGTYHVVRASEKFGVKKFVLISTDKAVNPTNFMGATKRFCEMILQSRKNSPTAFCAVRFGNVLGSNGSVVPLFKRQILSGGPVTITDKRIVRYFMTISEAAQLVLEAGAMAGRNEIYVLDMGKPVRILTLAENLIRLSGYEPYRDIDIKEVGLRPGEKLYEELLIQGETLSTTSNEMIFVERQMPIDPDKVMEDLKALDQAVTAKTSPQDLILLLRSMIPTYRSPEEVNAEAEREYGPVAI